MIVKLSPSQLAAWEAGTWYDRYFAASVEEKSIYMEIGTAFDYYVKQAIMEGWDCRFERADKMQADYDACSAQARQIAASAWRWYYSSPAWKRLALVCSAADGIFLEEAISVALAGGVLVRGYADFIAVLGHERFVLDWKVRTGASAAHGTGYVWTSSTGRPHKKVGCLIPNSWIGPINGEGISTAYNLQLGTYGSACNATVLGVDEIIMDKADAWSGSMIRHKHVHDSGLWDRYEKMGRAIADFDRLSTIYPLIKYADWLKFVSR